MGSFPDGSKINISFSIDQDLIIKTPIYYVLKGLKLSLNIIADCIELYFKSVISKDLDFYNKLSTTLDYCRKFVNRKTDIDWEEYLTFLDEQIINTAVNMSRNASIQILWNLYNSFHLFLMSIRYSWTFSKNSILNAKDAANAFASLLNSLSILLSKNIVKLNYTCKDLGRAIKLELTYDPIIKRESVISQEIIDLCEKDDLSLNELEYLVSYASDELGIGLFESHSTEKNYTLLLYKINPYAYPIIKGDWNYIIERINNSILLKSKIKDIILRSK